MKGGGGVVRGIERKELCPPRPLNLEPVLANICSIYCYIVEDIIIYPLI